MLMTDGHAARVMTVFELLSHYTFWDVLDGSTIFDSVVFSPEQTEVIYTFVAHSCALSRRSRCTSSRFILGKLQKVAVLPL